MSKIAPRIQHLILLGHNQIERCEYFIPPLLCTHASRNITSIYVGVHDIVPLQASLYTTGLSVVQYRDLLGLLKHDLWLSNPFVPRSSLQDCASANHSLKAAKTGHRSTPNTRRSENLALRRHYEVAYSRVMERIRFAPYTADCGRAKHIAHLTLVHTRRIPLRMPN